MVTYIHTLTPLEIECGVTLEDVARELPRGAFRDGRFFVSTTAGPALAGSVARAAFGGHPVEYAGRSPLGWCYYPSTEPLDYDEWPGGADFTR